MGKIRKLIDVDQHILHILEEEAKKQKHSLKSFMKYSLEETARRLESPSEAYRTMMDDMLKRLENNEVQFDPIQDIEKKYGL